MARYIVQTLDGEMEYGSIEQLRQAVEVGLVSADALVNEEGGFHGRPAGRVVQRPGQEVKSAQRAVPIPSPIPSYVLFALALAALLYVELPRLTVMYPALWKVPFLAELVQRPPDPAGWPLPISVPQLVAGVMLLAALARGLFAAAPQNALFFGALGAYFARTERMEYAIPCFAAVVTVIALGVRRLLARRAR